MAGDQTRAKKKHSINVHDANHTTEPSHFKIVWMFYIYLTTFILRHYIVGAENHFQTKFHDLISISFLHGYPFGLKLLFSTFDALLCEVTTKAAPGGKFKIFSSKIESYM
jgi:hypothetical protein